MYMLQEKHYARVLQQVKNRVYHCIWSRNCLKTENAIKMFHLTGVKDYTKSIQSVPESYTLTCIQMYFIYVHVFLVNCSI